MRHLAGMGNVISRCAQDVRNAWKRCAKKNAEEENMLSTCDSEPFDKCHEQLLDSGLDRVSRTGSPALAHRLDQSVTCHLLSSHELEDCSPSHTDRLGRPAVSTNDNVLVQSEQRLSSLVDRGSQTSFELCDLEKRALNKAYIIKTYSLQNATPSPSPGIDSKFAPSHHSALKSQCQPVSVGSAVTTTPMESLEARQVDVLKRLEQLQASVSKLSATYSVPVADKQILTVNALPPTKAIVSTSLPTAAAIQISPPTTIESHGQQLPDLPQGDRHISTDLVINADPSSTPLSLIVLCKTLSDRHKVFMSTYVHSSVSDSVSDELRALLTSNSGIKRGDSDFAITLIWKKVATGLQLLVDPTKQTTIEGEANVARYFTRLLDPSHDDNDIITATQIDEILDLAQLQLLDGKSKEKSAAVRTLNSQLGKTDWLTGSQPSVADIVCFSALHQTNQISNPPANVKKWLNLCGQHQLFQTVSALVS